jgi:hypothetical protein
MRPDTSRCAATVILSPAVSLRPGPDRTAHDGTGMTGVRIINPGNGVETALAAELVTDAMGGAARTSAFLDSSG